jgi:hypothetical protein
VHNAAARLAPGGVFVFEGFVPDPARLVGADVDHDPVQQRITSKRIVGERRYLVELRYIWPSELDLMA